MAQALRDGWMRGWSTGSASGCPRRNARVLIRRRLAMYSSLVMHAMGVLQRCDGCSGAGRASTRPDRDVQKHARARVGRIEFVPVVLQLLSAGVRVRRPGQPDGGG